MLLTLTMPQMITVIAALIIIAWRISDGYHKGILEEAAGVVALLAALAAIYMAMNIAEDITQYSFKGITTKIIYFVIAIFIYKIGHLVGRALRPVKDIPIIGGLDAILGAVLGAIEAYIIILLLQKIIGIDAISLIEEMITELCTIVRKYITNLKENH